MRLEFEDGPENAADAESEEKLWSKYGLKPPRRKEEVRAPQVGDRMPDGMIYAGISPDTGKPLYADAADAPLTMRWRKAMKYATAQDKRLPTKDELNVLFNNRAAIGGFNETGSFPAGWYWSSTEDYGFIANGQGFSDGFRGWYYKGNHSSVRLVRN